MRDDWDDGMSTVSHDEESEEEVSSPKRMRSESDDETSTVSNEDIFSSSDEGESPEEMNDSLRRGGRSLGSTNTGSCRGTSYKAQ